MPRKRLNEMLSDKVVIASFEDLSDTRCVDIIKYANGTFGFQLFRRDFEDISGWAPLAPPNKQCFKTFDELKLFIKRQYGEEFKLDKNY